MTARPRWIPNVGPQLTYLSCAVFEALYGGAAGGGKSEALLAGALRHIDKPSYRGILFRRTVPELKRSLIDRSQEMYRAVGGVYNGEDKIWTFPTGAKIALSSIEHEGDVYNYSSAEYQYAAFDELSSFTEFQYTFMISRLRSAHGIPIRLRSASNPGGHGHDWVLNRFSPWLYPKGHSDYVGRHAAPGERLYFRRDRRTDTDVICEREWFDPHCQRCAPGKACIPHRPRGRTFFPAFVSDNPFLAGTEYEANLELLDPVTRAQLKDGNWMARPAKGAYFKRHMFEIVDVPPAKVTGRVRYWDRAATAGGGDWTAGLLMSRTPDKLIFIEDVVRGQWGPRDVEGTIRTTCEIDAPGTEHVLEQDPAQAGKFEKEYYQREFQGFNLRVVPPQGDKITRAKPVSAQADAHNIKIVRGTWNEAFIRELESFPEGHDDQVDAMSGAFRQLLVGVMATPVTGGRRSYARAQGGF